MPIYACPACGKDNVNGEGSCQCGADLSILAVISGVSDVWFNRGLEAVAAGDLPQAVEWFGACCAAAPTDAAAWVAMAKLWLRLRHRAAARRAIEHAAQIDPQSPGVVAVQEVLGPRRRADFRAGMKRTRKSTLKKDVSASD